MPTDTDLVKRAIGAWIKFDGSGDVPTPSASTVERHQGHTYVVLRRGGHIVDVYRYKETENQLRRLRGYYPWLRRYRHVAA